MKKSIETEADDGNNTGRIWRGCRKVAANLYFTLHISKGTLLRPRVTTADQKGLRAVLRKRFPRDHGQLLPALHFVQHEYRYLPDWAMEVVGWHLGIPASEVYGAATSYTELLTVQPGRHVVQVCTGIACSINGGGRLLESLTSSLGIGPGETTPDGRITLSETACAFMCGVAPTVRFDHEWRGRATVESVNGLLHGSEES